MEKKETMKGDLKKKNFLKHFLTKYLMKDSRRYCVHETRPQCCKKNYSQNKKKEYSEIRNVKYDGKVGG